MITRIAQLMLLVAALGGGMVRAEIIDRILAVVDGAIVTQSDVIAAVRVGLLGPRASGEPATTALERLIERRLILTEVDRYAPPEPPDAEIDRRIAELRAAAESPAAFDAALRETGMALDQLRRYVRDDLRIQSYVQQRFGSVPEPSEEEILQYYREHEAEFARGGTLRSFADAHDDIKAALTAERRAATMSQWIAGLRRRANVNVLPL